MSTTMPIADKVASTKIARPIGLSAASKAIHKLTIGNAMTKVIAALFMAVLSLAAASK